MAALAAALAILSAGQISDRFSRFFPGIDGCCVLEDLKSGKLSKVNAKRVEKRFSPCSTFKIPNTIFGLTSGVTWPEKMYLWDGLDRGREGWNRDMTLEEAFKTSCYPIYRIVAKDIGQDRMAAYVKKLRYGNGDVSGGLDRFWLASSLKISATEQLEFLKKLWSNDLPFPKEHLVKVKEFMTYAHGKGWQYSGKTGSNGQGLGWWVGYAIYGEKVTVFAFNGQEEGLTGLVMRDKARKFMVDGGWLPKSAL